MLCQKCGLKEATVHLTSTVFRQKIEEHLCRLCAGDRAPSATDESATIASFERQFEDAFLGRQIEAMTFTEPITRKEEVALAKRLTLAEVKMMDALFQIPKTSAFVVALVERLLLRNEVIEKLVVIKTPTQRTAYLKALPRLLRRLQKTRRAFDEVAAQLGKTGTRAERKKTFTALAKIQGQMSRPLTQFRLRPEALRSHFAKLRFFTGRAGNLFQEIKASASMRKKARIAYVERRDFANRLLALGNEQQMEPRQFFSAAQRARSCFEKASLARRRLMQAHLFVVLAAAKKYKDRGVSIRELVGLGNGGLLQALEHFDHRRGYRFSTIAAVFVDEAMARFFSDLA